MILQNWPFADALAVFLMVVVFAVIYIQNLVIPNKQKGMVLH
jgi:ABC-type spermidine/putrescine transport system permease subunit I